VSNYPIRVPTQSSALALYVRFTLENFGTDSKSDDFPTLLSLGNRFADFIGIAFEQYQSTNNQFNSMYLWIANNADDFVGTPLNTTFQFGKQYTIVAVLLPQQEKIQFSFMGKVYEKSGVKGLHQFESSMCRL
jgi:uncharacterized protein YcgL (UPF0745 family)